MYLCAHMHVYIHVLVCVHACAVADLGGGGGGGGQGGQLPPPFFFAAIFFSTGGVCSFSHSTYNSSPAWR